MCLKISGFHTRKEAIAASQNPLIAERDINVYKILDKDGYSPFRVMKYDKGTHYYQTGKAFTVSTVKDFSCKWSIKVKRGLHSTTIPTRYDRITMDVGCYKSVRMVIPKGSKYFTNGIDYVSDNLIWY